MKEKRKPRLDKAEAKPQFIGFSSFADTKLATEQSLIAPATPSVTTSSSTAWSPVYTGSCDDFQLLFPRLVKRDPNTVAKALIDLQAVFTDENNIPKKLRAEGLQHYAYVYHHKLIYHDASKVRAEAFRLWVVCHEALPKAVGNLLQNYPEILAMLYSVNVDISAEVRQMAKSESSIAFFQQQYEWSQGISMFAKRILSYGRPSVMYQELFNKRGSNELNDQQKDAMEERFERIVGLALDCLEFWLRFSEQHRSEISSSEAPILWKTLSSSKSGLRRRTYHLLATAITHQPEIQPQNTVSLLVKSLASEKEGANISVLLETVLVYLSQDSSQHEDLVKPLSKLFKKACYGEKAERWSPLLLPLLSFFHNPVPLLQASFEGSELAIAVADKLDLLAAVSESASFFLLRRDNSLDSDRIPEILNIWAGVFAETLSKPVENFSGYAKGRFADLIEELAIQMSKFEIVDVTESTRALAQVQDEVFNLSEAFERSEPSTLCTFLEEYSKKRELDSPSPITPFLKKYFTSHVQPYCESSSSVPSLESYSYLLILINFAGATNLVEDLNTFVLNHVLRWMIIHTSSISEHSQNQKLVESVFRFFCRCLRDPNLWAITLDELIKAKCHCKWITVGLETLLRESDHTNWISCDQLDNFADEMARPYLKGILPVQDDRFHESCRYSLRFFQVCLGVDEFGEQIVSRDLYSTWIHSLIGDSYSPVNLGERRHSNPLLEVLLQLFRSNRNMGELEDRRIGLYVTAWRHGGTFFLDNIVEDVDNLPDELVVEMAKELNERLVLFLANSSSESVQDFASFWGDRAFSTYSLMEPKSNIFDHIRILNEGWVSGDTRRVDVLFHCLLQLLCKLSSKIDPLPMIVQSSTGGPDVIVEILLSCSGGDPNFWSSFEARERRDKSYQLLKQLGGRSIPFDTKMSLICSEISKVRSLVGKSKENFCFHVSVLSQLIEITFRPVSHGILEVMDGGEVREGSHLWYMEKADSMASSCFVPVLVTKVHFDSLTGHYFSIRDLTGVGNERQTVSSRLSRYPDGFRMLQGIRYEDLSIQEQNARAKVRKMIISSLTGYFRESSGDCGLLEFIPLVVCGLGVGPGRGIGSDHFSLFSVANEIRMSLLRSIESSEVDVARNSMKKLILTLGYGVNIPRCYLGDFELDLIPIFEELSRRSVIPGLSLYTLRLLSVYLSNPTASNEVCTVTMVGKLFLRYASAQLEIDYDDESFTAILFGLRDSIGNLKKSGVFECEEFRSSFSSCVALGIQRQTEGFDRIFAVHQVIFTRAWYTILNGWDNESLTWFLDSIVMDKLVDGIFAPSSQVLATYFLFRLLRIRPSDERSETDGDSINDLTREHLKIWVSGLTEEEAEEVKEDVEIVSRWLPDHMMNELETWPNESIDREDESHHKGRYLVWLLVMKSIDSASLADFRNRPAFVSYLSQCGTVDFILNTIVHSSEVISQGKDGRSSHITDILTALEEDSLLTVEELALHCFHRTIEVLPSLSRRWWENHCPRPLSSAVQLFIEKHVAGLILSNEISNLKAGKNFGEMSVVASSISRQITATYVQDDFKLHVTINLPGSFPLRSAEVDCSKTLGIPGKKLKGWSLQIRKMLSNEGGTLKDALLLWKDNVDREFEGIEPCPVCYSVLQVKTHKLPTLQCKTCGNCFHFDCLMQWFRESGKNQCVLCQQPWQGTRI